MLQVEVEPLEDGRFLAVSTNLQGCMAEGDTIAEALDYIEDVARVIIEFRRREGWSLPEELQPGAELPIVKAELVVSV